MNNQKIMVKKLFSTGHSYHGQHSILSNGFSIETTGKLMTIRTATALRSSSLDFTEQCPRLSKLNSSQHKITNLFLVLLIPSVNFYFFFYLFLVHFFCFFFFNCKINILLKNCSTISVFIWIFTQIF